MCQIVVKSTILIVNEAIFVGPIYCRLCFCHYLWPCCFQVLWWTGIHFLFVFLSFYCCINLSTMEVSQSDAGTSGSQDQKLQMSSKPLHRFIKGEPKSLGVILKLRALEVLRNMFENRQSYRLHAVSVLTFIFFLSLFLDCYFTCWQHRVPDRISVRRGSPHIYGSPHSLLAGSSGKSCSASQWWLPILEVSWVSAAPLNYFKVNQDYNSLEEH